MKKNKKILPADWIYIACIVASLAVIGALRGLNGFSDSLWITDISSMIGIFASIALAKHHPSSYILFVVCNGVLIYTTWVQQVYFSFANFIVGSMIMLWGFISFLRNNKVDEMKNAKKLSSKQWLFFSLFFVVVLPSVMVGLWALNSNLFYLDAIAVAGTLTATILISNQFYEAYYFYIIGNLASIAMFTVLTIGNLNNIGTVIMFVVFQVTNIIGLKNWKQIYKNQQDKLAINKNANEGKA